MYSIPPAGFWLRRLLPVLLPVLLRSSPVFAQQGTQRLTLARLFELSDPTPAQAGHPGQDHSQDLNDWTFKPATAQAELEPLTWAWWPASADTEEAEEAAPRAVTPGPVAGTSGPGTSGPEPVKALPSLINGPVTGSGNRRLPPLQLSLRPLAKGYDVVLFVRRLSVFNQLHRELDRQRLEAVPVTCIGQKCLGERFTTAAGTVAFYQGKPGDYAYIIVLHPVSGPVRRAVRVSEPTGAKTLLKALPTSLPATPPLSVADSLGRAQPE